MQRTVAISSTLRKERVEKVKEIEIRILDVRATLKKNKLIMAFYTVLSSPM